jgi:hypothetical protein
LAQEGSFFTATEILVDLFCFALNSYKGIYKMNNELDPVTNWRLFWLYRGLIMENKFWLFKAPPILVWLSMNNISIFVSMFCYTFAFSSFPQLRRKPPELIAKFKSNKTHRIPRISPETLQLWTRKYWFVTPPMFVMRAF